MVTFEVQDMTCGHCVSSITKAVRAIDQGARVTADLATHQVRIEPTESEPIEELDAFADAMIAIAREAEESPELVTSAPHVTPVGRVDEALLAREASKPGSFAPVLRAPVRRS